MLSSDGPPTTAQYLTAHVGSVNVLGLGGTSFRVRKISIHPKYNKARKDVYTDNCTVFIF